MGDSLKLDTSLTGDLQIKQEPLILSDAEMHAMAKDRQKKDNHNMSKFFKDLFCLFVVLLCKYLDF